MQPPLERWDHNTREALARTLGSREEKGRSHSKPSRTRRKKKKKSARDREQVRQVSRQFSGGSLAKEQQQSQTHHRESEEKSRY